MVQSSKKSKNICALDSGYSSEVDNVSRQEWSNILIQFDDASIYQTCEYGVTHWVEKNLSHLILKKDDNIVAITQIRLFKIPVIKGGIAYVRWGPLWKLKNSDYDFNIFQNILRALYREYVINRGLSLKIFPRIFKEDDISKEIKYLFLKESFKFTPDPHRTMLFPLFHPIETLRKGLDRRWRQKLVKSEKENLKLTTGAGDDLFNIGLSIYQKMLKRKQFTPLIEIEKFFTIQRILPETLKLKISLCYDKGEPVAFIIWSQIGTTAVALFAGTTDKALNSYASFFSWWKLFEHLKENGCQWVDLGGINPERNPGSYRFKAGICKNIGKEVSFLGQFEACKNVASNILLITSKLIKSYQQKLKLLFEKNTLKKLLSITFAIYIIFYYQSVHAGSNNCIWGVMPIRSEQEFNKGEIGGEGFQHPHSIARCRNKPDIIYVAIDGAQVWRSGNAGEIWHKVRGEGFMVRRTQSIEVDPIDPDIVFVIAENHSNTSVTWAQEFVGLYRSKDGGKNWKHILHAPNMMLRSYQHNITYDPASITPNGATLWYSAFFPNENLYRSENSGDTWSSVCSLKNYKSIYCIQAHPTDGRTIYMATDLGLFYSSNNGSSFQNLGDLPSGEVSSIAINENNPSMIYTVLKDNGLYRSLDGGEHFFLLRDDVALFVFINPGYPDVIYLVRSSSNLIVSKDGGSTWNTNVKINPPEGLEREWKKSITGKFSGVVPNPRNKDEAVAYCHANFWKSTDCGVTFNNSSTLFTGAAWSFYNNGVSFDVKDPGRFFFFCNDFSALFTENNSDWFERHRPEGLGVWPGSYAGDILPVTESKILVANIGDYFKTKLMRSIDGGLTWAITDTNIENNLFIAFHPDSHHIVFAGNKISSDTGAIFKKIEYLSNKQAEILGLCLSKPNTIYAITKPRKTILRSDDKGDTWQEYVTATWYFNRIDSKPIFTVHPNNPDKIYTLDKEGDLAEYDGKNWKSFGVLELAGGADIGNFVKSVALDPRHPNIIYVGMAYPGLSHLWRSIDSGATWENITGNHPMVGTGALKVHHITGDLIHGTGFGTWVFPPPYVSPHSLFPKCIVYGVETSIQKKTILKKTHKLKSITIPMKNFNKPRNISK